MNDLHSFPTIKMGAAKAKVATAKAKMATFFNKINPFHSKSTQHHNTVPAYPDPLMHLSNVDVNLNRDPLVFKTPKGKKTHDPISITSASVLHPAIDVNDLAVFKTLNGKKTHDTISSEPLEHPLQKDAKLNDPVLFNTPDGKQFALERDLIKENSPFLKTLLDAHPKYSIETNPFESDKVSKVMDILKDKKYEDAEWLQSFMAKQSPSEINDLLQITSHLDLPNLLDKLYDSILFLQEEYWAVVKGLDHVFQDIVLNRKKSMHKVMEERLEEAHIKFQGPYITLDDPKLDLKNNPDLKDLLVKASYLFGNIEIHSASGLDLIKESKFCKRVPVFIDLKNQVLEPKDVENSMANANVVDLSIQNCALSTTFVKVLSKELTKLSNLISFTFENSNIGDREAKILSKSLESQKRIESISLAHNSIGNKGFSAIMKGLKSVYLQDLSLNGNKISNIQPLADTAPHLPNLAYINLNGNSIRGSSVASVISAFNKKTSKLQTLLLRKNLIEDKDGKKMALELSDSNIVGLDLQENLFKKDGVLKLVETLPDSKVKYLGLAYNNVNPQVANQLVDILKHHKMHLKALTLSYNHYGGQFAQSFEKMCGDLHISCSLDSIRPENFQPHSPTKGRGIPFGLFRVVENEMSSYQW